MDNQASQPAGIQFVFFDRANDVPVTLGGAIFDKPEEAQQEWKSIPPFDGKTDFIADQLNADCDIIGDKPVSVEIIEAKLGKSISTLIAEGRLKNPDIASSKTVKQLNS